MKSNLATLYSILFATPWWVFLVLAYCIYKSFKALRPSHMTLSGLFTLPIISCTLFMRSLIKTAPLESKIIAYTITIVIIGSLIGFLFGITHKPTINKKKNIFIVPGSVWVPILVITTFIFQYYCGYITATNHSLSTSTSFLMSKIFIGGIISGLSNGRALGYLYKYYKA